MIEFDGYLTGVAKNHFFRRWSHFVRTIIVISMAGVLCPIVLFFVNRGDWKSLTVIAVCFAVVFLCTFLQKKDQKLLTKKIVISEETITCITDKQSESRLIFDVKTVRDYGEFYEILFPIGKVSFSFICQKSLLSKGSLEEFESLFHDKIEDMTK